jgi:GNAT superfamily N-acetyltransferase
VSRIAVRDAEPRDALAIFDLERRLAEFEHLEDLFVATLSDYEAMFQPGSPARVIVAEVDGEFAGIALYFLTFSTFLGRAGIWLEDLFVKEAFRRRGVASALMEELRRRTEGRLEWEVLDWNERAISLYDKLGAEPSKGWTKYRISPT